MRRVRSLRRALFIRALRKRKLSDFLKECKRKGILPLYLRELEDLEEALQDPFYHPEGDAWVHTLRCVGIAESEGYPLSIVLASLLHDVGKALLREDLTYRSHERKSARITVKFFFRFPMVSRIASKIKSLVRNHMKFHHPLSERTIKRLIRSYPYLDELVSLTEVDLKGSSGYSKTFLENMERLRRLREEMTEEEKKPPPLLNGNEIMRILNIPPGKKVGELKELVYLAQLEGYIANKEEAVKFLRKITG